MKVLSRDGLCSWTTFLHLSDLDLDVIIIDNLSRLQLDDKLGIKSSLPITGPSERIEAYGHGTVGAKITVGCIQIELASGAKQFFCPPKILVNLTKMYCVSLFFLRTEY
jgi:hypothetical protein